MAAAAHDAWQDLEGRSDLHENVAMGADGTPTTRADAILDGAILDIAADEGISVLSEEAGFVDHGSDAVAVVDPLDGSRNAGRGIPFYCTSIAIGTGDLSRVHAGVVQNLVTGDAYTAEQGKGAFLNDAPVTPRPFDPNEIMVAVIADYADPEMVDRLQRRKHHLRDLGSAALEMCLVGTGALDAFEVHRPWLRVIDIAAATLFIREAGGIVIDPATRESLATPFNLDVRTGVLAAKAGSEEVLS